MLHAQLVLRRDLPRQPQALVLIAFEAVGGPRGVWRVRMARRRQVIEDAGQRLLRRLRTDRSEKPQLVFLQRSANRRIDIVRPLRRRRRREAAGFQAVAQIVALQVVVGVGAEDQPSVGIAAVFRHEVDPDAARFALRREAGRLDGHFLHGRIVGHDGDELAAASLAVVEVHAVVERRLFVQAAAMDRETDGGKRRAAHVLAGAGHAWNEHADLAG
jgi:hypothetical protein